MELERRLGQGEAVLGGDRGERLALVVVVAEHAEHRHLDLRQQPQRRGPGDVAGVDHALHPRRAQQLDDPADVARVVVGVTDHSDAHAPEGNTR